MINATFHSASEIPDERIGFAVICAHHRGKWIFVRHKSRTSWEIPGGHREVGESVEEAARRELYEETGASAYELFRLGIYGVDRDGEYSYGGLYFAEVSELGELPESEIGEMRLFDRLPDELTYPQIQPELYKKANAFKCPPMGLRLRTAGPSDAEVFARVLCESWKTAYADLISPEEMAKNTDLTKKTNQMRSMLAAPDAVCFIAYDNDRAVGICDTRPSRESNDCGEIVAIYALAEYRGRGVGAALMDAALESLAGRGFNTVALNTFEQNLRARSFYERYGFVTGGSGFDSGLSGQRIVRYEKSFDKADA